MDKMRKDIQPKFIQCSKRRLVSQLGLPKASSERVRIVTGLFNIAMQMLDNVVPQAYLCQQHPHHLLA